MLLCYLGPNTKKQWLLTHTQFFLYRAKDQLTGKRSDYLIVALDMFFYGDGWSQNNILQARVFKKSNIKMDSCMKCIKQV